MSAAERWVGGLALVFLCVTGVGGAAEAEPITPAVVFPDPPRARTRSAEDVLSVALAGWQGFSGAASLSVERTRSTGGVERSAFLLERRDVPGGRGVLVVSLEPAEERGNRVLQISYDDGREETFVFVPRLRTDPLEARYRLAEPFLVRWHSVPRDEPRRAVALPADYEILGFTPIETRGERGYGLSVRSLVPRGYDRIELDVAGDDLAVLERRYYVGSSARPTLVARVKREDLISFDGRTVPSRIVYDDRAQGARIEVRARYAPLPEDSAALFSPSTFHVVPIEGL